MRGSPRIRKIIEKSKPHIWFDDYGAARIGHTGDMIQMLQDLGISDRAF